MPVVLVASAVRVVFLPPAMTGFAVLMVLACVPLARQVVAHGDLTVIATVNTPRTVHGFDSATTSRANRLGRSWHDHRM